ncbi:hypothetical protein NEOLEDRAFT_388404 [Neolentinus lepideus HHB14362 ss-1]|uniref:Uncharacterized protein n=1 Tax=Neolentinus lepideus HHB14362 ss-1 TaxID=1314782 RepID=A0A165SF76_9AGAM|nr:hypothetical protein NEOLEDRAFT_388404 [Neolentinus lepideus HHB14362 ss-1]
MQRPIGTDFVGSCISGVRDHEQLLYEYNVLLSFRFCKTLESSCEIPCSMNTRSRPDRLDKPGTSAAKVTRTSSPSSPVSSPSMFISSSVKVKLTTLYTCTRFSESILSPLALMRHLHFRCEFLTLKTFNRRVTG